MKSLLRIVVLGLLITSCGDARVVDAERATYESLAFENTGRTMSGLPVGDVTDDELQCFQDQLEERDVDLVEILAGSSPQDDVEQYIESLIVCVSEIERFEPVMIGMMENMTLISGAEVTRDEVECMFRTARAENIDVRIMLAVSTPTQDELLDFLAVAQTCLSEEALIGLGLSSGGADLGYGDDPALDELYSACSDGDDRSCDLLYWDAPLMSEYEAFAATCGGRGDGDGSCSLPDQPRSDAQDLGDDPALDGLVADCLAGEYAACDLLFFVSPLGSEYESVGDTCGDRLPLGAIPNCRVALR